MCLDFTLASSVLAASDMSGYLAGALAILAAAAGLGFIILVHELGHFLVAKACGVKCDKFMIGFDIGGYKIGKQVGETYYGIGILPLGGYVRMMGQNDDPRMSAEQIRESEATTGDEGVETKEIKGPDGKMHQVDARSYIAKTVPQRMAIISAGVVMNVIFAFIFALIAFRVGVPSIPCIVGSTDPGAPAWQAGWRANDVILRIDNIENPWFEQLQSEVTLSGEDEPVEFEIEKAETGEIETYSIQPSRKRKLAQIGIGNPWSLDLLDEDPTRKFTPAAKVSDKIPGGSHIVAVNGQPVETWRDLQGKLATSAAEPISLTLQPKAKKAKDAKPEPVEVTIDANPAEYVGLVMKMGPITAVQDDSPAAEAGLKAGDTIVAINGTPVGMVDESTVGWDPRTLAARLDKMGRSGESVELTVLRGSDKENKASTETLNVPLRSADWYEIPLSEKSPTSAPSLGIAYYLLNEVAGVVPGSPAAEADIEPGDRLSTVKLVIDKEYEKEYAGFKEPFELTDDKLAWAFILANSIQDTPPGSKLELELLRGESEKAKKLKVSVDIVTDNDTHIPQRGITLMPIERIRIGKTFGEQVSMAMSETQHALTSVYRFLYRIINREIDPRLLGGPITIAKASYLQALDGPGRLLLFLTLISANLAVVNFLPIPVLDGGHMVFLAWEGIFRRPPVDWIAGALNLAGLAFIICLMLFVFGLDLGLIPRNL